MNYTFPVQGKILRRRFPLFSFPQAAACQMFKSSTVCFRSSQDGREAVERREGNCPGEVCVAVARLTGEQVKQKYLAFLFGAVGDFGKQRMQSVGLIVANHLLLIRGLLPIEGGISSSNSGSSSNSIEGGISSKHCD